MSSTKPLTQKQEAFAREYALTKDATAAYRKAYDAANASDQGAAANGRKLLRDTRIALMVERLNAKVVEIAEKTFEITAHKILQELATIGFANVQDYLTVDEQGIPMPNFKEVTRQQFAAIGEVTFEDIETGQRTGKRVKFKLLDKKGALVDLGKHIGLFKEQLNVNVRGSIAHKHTTAEDVAKQDDPREALKTFDAFRATLANPQTVN